MLAACVMGLMTAAAPSVDAHNPTPEWNHEWTKGQAVPYQWDASVVAWVKPIFSDIIEVKWPDGATNNSNGPRFALAASSTKLKIFFTPTNPILSTANWLGTADTSSLPNRIWLRSDPQSFSKKWCDQALVSGCPDLGRVSIHETTHVGGATGHNLQNVRADSVMHGCSLDGSTCSTLTFPFNPSSMWNRDTIGRCDEAMLQLRYGLEDLAGPYADCFDHISNHGTYGLKTDLTTASTSISVCQGLTATMAGRLQVHAYSSYGEMSGDSLAGRVVYFDIDGAANAASATAGTSGANNWSRGFTNATYGTKNYIAHFDRPAASGLDSSPDRPFSITWIPAALC